LTWEYEWSSTAYHVGIKNKDVPVTDSDLLKEIDNWRLYLSGNDKDIEELRLKTRTERPAGGEGFIAKAERIVSRVLRPGKAGRPRKN